MEKGGALLEGFYTRLVSKDGLGEDSDDKYETTFSFTGRDLDNSGLITVISLNDFMPIFDSITLDVLGNIHEKRYKNLWTISMILTCDNWLKFVEFTNKINTVLTCERKNIRTGARKLIPIFYMGSLVKGPWEYSIDSYNMMSDFKWGSLRVFVSKEICRIRIQIEDVVDSIG